jgi:ribosome biogenesis GTPase
MDVTLAAYGWNDHWAATFAPFAAPGCEPGRVLRHDRIAFIVATSDGVVQLPALRPVGPLTVGDWVVVRDGEITDLLPRASLLRRRAPEAGEQLLAANVDIVAMVFGADRPLKAGRLFRTRTQVSDAGATPLVVLTKTDLLDDVGPLVDRVHVIDPLLDTIAVSSVDGVGLDALRARIAGKTLVLVGESGAGKSTLVNALAGGDIAAVSHVRETDHRGRHTTTSRELYPLPDGGVLIDTPGLREIGLWTDDTAVDGAFPEMDELADACRFRDCSHGPEPGCAVRAAVADGRVSAERFAAWLALRDEAAAVTQRAEDHAKAVKAQQGGRPSKDPPRQRGPR